MALPMKVKTAPTESQVKSNFRLGLKSRVSLSRLALTEGEVFCGRGFPPGPVCLVEGRTMASFDAVAML